MSTRRLLMVILLLAQDWSAGAHHPGLWIPGILLGLLHLNNVSPLMNWDTFLTWSSRQILKPRNMIHSCRTCCRQISPCRLLHWNIRSLPLWNSCKYLIVCWENISATTFSFPWLSWPWSAVGSDHCPTYVSCRSVWSGLLTWNSTWELSLSW